MTANTNLIVAMRLFLKLASIDVGFKRIGVAICLVSNIVTPQNAILKK